MRQEKIKIIISWLLVAVCMIVIFWLSSRTADESSEQSSAVLEWLIKTFGDGIFTTFIVRKSAHFCEYAGLCLLLCNAFYQTKGKFCAVYSVAAASLYSVTDEIHQLFVDGRSCEIRDWAIDTAGAAVGMIAAYIIFRCISRKNGRCISKKKRH